MKYILAYIDFVRSGEVEQCIEQYQFCDLIEKAIKRNDFFVDEKLVESYLSLQKYFPFKLFLWEKCLLVLFLCSFWKDTKLPRFSELFILVARGSGKNGFLSFLGFCLLSPYNPIKSYNVDIFANSESQAETSFKEIYNVLNGENTEKLKRFFKWNKVVIKGIENQGELKFWTSNPGTKDGFRPGLVVFDERHQYENSKLIDVAEGGLGKIDHPRILTTTTDGFVRGSVLDEDKENAKQILSGAIQDDSILPFICKIDSLSDIDDEKNWYKANPSLKWMPSLLAEIRRGYNKYARNRNEHPAFPTKRMNFPVGEVDTAVTSWENILATNQDFSLDDFKGFECIVGIDYASVTDFVSAGLLFFKDNKYYWHSHSWVCRYSKDLSRIKAPLQEWESKGLLTFIDLPTIPPETPIEWCIDTANQLGVTIVKIALDKYRHNLLALKLAENGFDNATKNGNLKLVRPSDEMILIPSLETYFIDKKIVWGDSPIMRWYCNNSKIEKIGINRVFGKQEAKSRKTDGFKAFVAAMIESNLITHNSSNDVFFDVYTY